jgi:hypothetical protein
MDPTGAQAMGQLVVNCLAVGGGFLVGWAGVAGLGKLPAFRASPKSLHTLSRNAGGLALAILVALVVFGHGHGWTLMGGGAKGNENGGETTSPVSTAVTQPSEAKDDATTPTALKPAAPIDERIRVTVLGGDDVKQERFYLVDDDTAAKTIDEAKAAITAKRNSLAGKRVGVEIRFTANALPTEHPAVARLVRWCRTEAGLAVAFPAE